MSNLDKEALKKSRAIIGFNYCEQIYTIEKELREEYFTKANFFEIRHKERLKRIARIPDDFEQYVKIEIENVLTKSPLGQALDYSQKLLLNMRIILEGGSLEVDNNAAERAIKPFIIGRKNWLFANSEKGANSSAIIYSIIETAKSHGLSVEKYLVYLMDVLSNENTLKEGDLLESMPWSKSLAEDLKVQTK